jgi:hypothetical protein
MASGTLLARWDDDDIRLPHRLELSRHYLGDRDYFNPHRYWFLDHRGLHWDGWQGVGHNLALFRRRAWQAVGGYPAVSGREDMDMDRALNRHPDVRCRVDEEPLRLPDWYYIYRWGVSPSHLSAGPDMQGRYDALGEAPVAAGRFELRPHWRGTIPPSWPPLAVADRVAQGPAWLRPRRTGRGPTGRMRHHVQAGGGLLDGIGRVGTGLQCGLLPAIRATLLSIVTRPTRPSPSPTIDDDLLALSPTEAARQIADGTRTALASFRRRMVLVVSTPFVRATAERRLVSGLGSKAEHIEIHFCRRDLVAEFNGIPFRLEENFATDSPFGREHVFYLCKDGPA